MQVLLRSLMRSSGWRSLAGLLTLSIVCTSSLAVAQPKLSACDFSTAVPLRTTTQYGIFGNDEFDTVACGYLVTRTAKIFDETVTLAYLRIVKFQDEKFRQAIVAGVQQGNGVNSVQDGSYDFSLGCIQDQTIVADLDDNPAQPYLLPAAKTEILQSSAAQPVSLIFSFSNRAGSDCVCCNLAQQIRLVKTAIPAP